MLHRYASIGLLILSSFACKGKQAKSSEANELSEVGPKTPVTADQKPAPAQPAGKPAVQEPGVPADFLVGKWSSECINSQDGSIQASRVVQYEFVADGSAILKELSYRGANCSLRYTKADVDALKVQINADRANAMQNPLSPEELARLDSLWFPQPNPFKFKLGRKLKDDTIEIDTTVSVKDLTSTDPNALKEISAYLVLYVEDELLYFAATCSKAEYDASLCPKIVGQIPSDRGRDLRQSPPLHKI